MAKAWNGASSRRWALLPLRLVVGYGFIAHGAVKWSRGPENFAKLLHYVGAPLPTATAWVVTLLEVFGGLAILVGAFVAIVMVRSRAGARHTTRTARSPCGVSDRQQFPSSRVRPRLPASP